MTNPHPESSPTPSHLPKPCMRKTSFSKQFLLFSKLYYRSIDKKNMGLPSEANVLESFPKQSWPSSEMIRWTISQPHSPEIHHMKFLSKTFSFFFQFFMSCTYLISRLPNAYEMHYAISHNIYNTCKYTIMHIFT